MKGINLNGTIKTYSSVPKTWGNTLGVNYMSDEDLKGLGFYDVVRPSLSTGQEYGDIYFDSTNEVFTYPINNITYTQTLQEIKDDVLSHLKETYRDKLSKTDWYVIRKQETQEAIPQDIINERLNLRSEYNSHKSSINAKTTKVSVLDYNF